MQRMHFRIGELAEKVGVECFVIRFWEKEFKLKSPRSRGGQRFYTQKELETFQTIKNLLYEQKFTIEGAKNVMSDPKNIIIGSYRTDLRTDPQTTLLYKNLKNLREQLIKFKEML
jgi:DNA-binding transcriptional MerR regulator